MAPLKTVKLPPTGSSHVQGIKTRSQGVPTKKDVFPKRKAEESPLKRMTVKRSAFSELTNVQSDTQILKHVSKENAIQVVKAKLTTTATLKKTVMPVNTQAGLKTELAKRKPLADQKNHINIPRPVELKAKPPVPAKPLKKQDAPATVNSKQPTNVPVPIKAIRKQHQHENHVQSVGVMTRRSLARKSLELEKSSDSTLYVSALEDLNLEDSSKPSSKSTKKVVTKTVVKPERVVPPGVNDYDQEQLKDLFSASIYAMDIFDYLKRREKDFEIEDYISRQKDLTTSMRSLLVDWMVEIQENFELNHESLYLAVKLVDLYLSKKTIKKESLQLVGATGLFIASKYDERLPPNLDDFVYVCDGLYPAEDLMEMEKAILRCVDFQLGIPLSYRFLRRYSRCGKYDMNLLTLARFILETSLMDYAVIRCSDSKMAAASLYLALKMKGLNWTKTLEYYSGYQVDDFKSIVVTLNNFLHKPKTNVSAIRKKYGHPLFYEVSKVPLIPPAALDFTTESVS